MYGTSTLTRHSFKLTRAEVFIFRNKLFLFLRLVWVETSPFSSKEKADVDEARTQVIIFTHLSVYVEMIHSSPVTNKRHMWSISLTV